MTDALYQSILADPADDTLRLAYADWLDETAGPDNDHADRAELIRAELDPTRPRPEDDRRPIRVANRERDLLAAHPEWFRLRCPSCGGDGTQGRRNGHDGLGCLACGGTGDLFRWRRGTGQDAQFLRETGDRTLTFRAGFPDSVPCTLAELGTFTATTFVPSAWATAVVRAVPVTRFRVTDRAPEVSVQLPGWSRWYTSGGALNEIPEQLYAGLEGEHPEHELGKALLPYWQSSAGAVEALVRSAGDLVRAAVYGKKEVPV